MNVYDIWCIDASTARGGTVIDAAGVVAVGTIVSRTKLMEVNVVFEGATIVKARNELCKATAPGSQGERL